jgi:hypothetical protein
MRSFESLEREYNEPPDHDRDERLCIDCDVCKVPENEDGLFLCQDCEEMRADRDQYVYNRRHLGG